MRPQTAGLGSPDHSTLLWTAGDDDQRRRRPASSPSEHAVQGAQSRAPHADGMRETDFHGRPKGRIMTPSPRDAAERNDLVERLCNEDLDAPGRKRLAELLAGDLEAQREYVRYVDLHA